MSDLQTEMQKAFVPRDTVQRYFASLETETRKPHCSEFIRETYRNLLKLAQEQGIYAPE